MNDARGLDDTGDGLGSLMMSSPDGADDGLNRNDIHGDAIQYRKESLRFCRQHHMSQLKQVTIVICVSALLMIAD